ncbi:MULTISPECIES: beta-galactosidase [Pseudovibrio]|uniref:beta-galactosidase n=1 Tax=Stappiaceae TaxID=2821832 RepID=UPI002365623D|nr:MULTISPECIES: beta-galactosidase [Pseudovibrio]MDD7911408.1 beta-galactosidase [Pseudovibrio exalbescens]MDX5592905.1 beta-galactosidase [Pseudovibrio sp. SPO723]
MTQEKTLGVCYYPEHWDEALWEQDAREMAELGITWVRIAEFAWSRIEPEPGTFQWEWLDRAVETLARNGLKIVMCTPTATPPRWMLDKHPDMLAHDENGNPRKFGSRRHYCFSHEGYREESKRISRIIAERYGQHPAVAAWQTDNEYGCHDTIRSWSPVARVAFQRWLEVKYGTVEKLNEAWGNVFWSMEYGSFDKIDLPYLTVTESNPAHRLDFYRFSSDKVAEFNQAQVEMLRELSPGRPIIHNFMGRFFHFDHYKVGDQLDVASWDSYPLGFHSLNQMESGTEMAPEFWRDFFQQGDPDFQGFHHDLYRAAGNGRLWIMEQQPGPVNWAPYNPSPLDGMVRLWSWEAFAHGAETTSYFRWRQAPFAQEQMHAGLKRPDNAPAQAFKEAGQVARERDALGAFHIAPAPVALVFDYESQWAHETQPQSQDFTYSLLAMNAYRALRELGVDVDIVRPSEQDLSRYKAVIVPGLYAVSAEFSSCLATYASQGGLVVAGPRFAQKNEHYQISQETSALPAPFEAVEVARVSTMPKLFGETLLSRDGSKFGEATIWVEELVSSLPTILALENGDPIVVGNESVVYTGAWLRPQTLKKFLAQVLEPKGIEPVDLPQGLRRRKTSIGTFYYNYAKHPQDLRALGLAEAAELDGLKIPAAGVSLVR